MHTPTIPFPSYFIGLRKERYDTLEAAISAAKEIVRETSEPITVFVREAFRQPRRPLKTIVDAESFWNDPHTTTTEGATE